MVTNQLRSSPSHRALAGNHLVSKGKPWSRKRSKDHLGQWTLPTVRSWAGSRRGAPAHHGRHEDTPTNPRGVAPALPSADARGWFPPIGEPAQGNRIRRPMSRQTGELVGFWEAERCWYEVETRWTAITTGRGTTGPQPPRCAGSRGRLRSPHRVAPRLQGSEGFGRGFQPCQPEYPNRGFVSSIGRDCKARTAGEACPVHAARPHVSHPPRSANL